MELDAVDPRVMGGAPCRSTGHLHDLAVLVDHELAARERTNFEAGNHHVVLMWGPGWWGPPMWGFWWIFPLVGLVFALVFVFAIARAVGRGGQFLCMGGPRTDNGGELAELRREVRELRQELRHLKGDG